MSITLLVEKAWKEHKSYIEFLTEKSHNIKLLWGEMGDYQVSDIDYWLIHCEVYFWAILPIMEVLPKSFQWYS